MRSFGLAEFALQISLSHRSDPVTDLRWKLVDYEVSDTIIYGTYPGSTITDLTNSATINFVGMRIKHFTIAQSPSTQPPYQTNDFYAPDARALQTHQGRTDNTSAPRCSRPVDPFPSICLSCPRASASILLFSTRFCTREPACHRSHLHVP
jgi:hypothetical protein